MNKSAELENTKPLITWNPLIMELTYYYNFFSLQFCLVQHSIYVYRYAWAGLNISFFK